MGLFRYPKTNAKMLSVILARLDPLFALDESRTFVEPFCGSCSLTLPILTYFKSYIDRVILNDANYAVYCVWRAVHRHPDQLIQKIRQFKPSLKSFYEIHEEFQLEDYYKYDTVDVAWRKIALHQMSARGLGEMAGGPNGGEEQNGREQFDTRWCPSSLESKIVLANSILNSHDTTILNKSFATVDAPAEAVYLFDPPDFGTGTCLYPTTMSISEHKMLANMCRGLDSWVTLYKNNRVVRKLYESIGSIGYGGEGYLRMSPRWANKCDELVISSEVI